MADAAEPPPPNPAQPAAANLAAAPRNRNGGQNNLFNVRERLFHAIYFKVALMYAQVFPPWMRRTLEYFILFKALLFFGALVYLHWTFIKNPATCLQHVKDWPRDGVLRVEVIPNLEDQRALLRRTKSYEKLLTDLQQSYHYGTGPQTKDNFKRWRQYEQILKEAGYQLQTSYITTNETITYLLKTDVNIAMEPPPRANDLKLPPMQTTTDSTVDADDGDLLYSILFKRSAFLMLLDTYGNNADEQYIVEYSLEYGHLRLSPTTRKRLRIPVRVVQLDPMKDKCFGDDFSKFMLKKVLGYDDLLMASVRVIAEQENNHGYLRNVVTGEHYRFVSMWWAAWSSYPTALAVMLLFTFSISMLLRFSHHQIFVFIVDLLQMLEFNVTASFPIAPLLTVILALVGMEAIMSEFFNDTTTAFYIILIVWIADQYDAICCHTSITKRHWLRFFFLYHFAFYAYHYRFSGQNRNLSLITSWLFIQHSMLFFFHRFELPVISQQAHFIILTRNRPNAAAAVGGANANNNGDGNALGAAGVAGEGAAGTGGAAAAATGQQPGGRRVLFFRRPTSAAAPQQQQQPPAAEQAQAFRLPLFNILPLRNRPLRWDIIQRALLQRGWRANVPAVRVQLGNIHRINVQHGVVQIDVAAHYAARAAAATTASAATNAPNNANPNATNASEAGASTSGSSGSGGSSVDILDGTNVTTATTNAQETTENIVASETIYGNSQTAESNQSECGIAVINQQTSPSAVHLPDSNAVNITNENEQQQENITTGNNIVKQPETVEQKNKIENKVTEEQEETKQQKNNEKEEGGKEEAEVENSLASNVDDENDKETLNGSKYPTNLSATTTTKIIKQINQKPLEMTATNALTTTNLTKNNNNEQLVENNFCNLKNELVAEVEQEKETTKESEEGEEEVTNQIERKENQKVGSLLLNDPNTIKSDQQPQIVGKMSIKPTITTTTATIMMATGAENYMKQQNDDVGDGDLNDDDVGGNQKQFVKELKENIVAIVANAENIAQTINQAKIEEEKVEGATTTTFPTNENFNMIDSIETVENCCNNSNSITTTTTAKTKFNYFDTLTPLANKIFNNSNMKSSATTTLDNNQKFLNFQLKDKTSTRDVSDGDGNSDSGGVAVAVGGNDSDSKAYGGSQNQLLTNFLANEVATTAATRAVGTASATATAHSSEF